MADDVRKILLGCIDELKPNEKKCIECEMKGMSRAEIAEECGYQVGGMQTTLNRIHVKLGKMMKTFIKKDEGE
jgi:DNA-directed RNA polymerase specialized sigma24 family protein